MGLAETADLVARLSLKGDFTRKMTGATKALDTFDTKLDRTQSRAYRAGQQIGTGIRNGAKIAAVGVGLLVSQVAFGLRSLVDLEQQEAQTAAVIKSTGGVAGVTATEVGRLAEKYESLNATVGDETIREGENLLLTYTNIRKKAFEPALAAALDMNTALGKGPDGLTGTVKVLGKALNDPTKGLSALSRVGVTFDKRTADRIKLLQKEGDLYGAQSLILAELDKRFGGSFLGQGNTTAGKVAKAGDAIEDLQRILARTLLPTVGNVADALSDTLQDPAIIRGAEKLGTEIGKLFSADNIQRGAKVVGDVVRAIADAAPTIASGLSTAATVIGGVLSAFQKLPPEVQQLAIGALAVNKLTGGLITNVAGSIFGALKSMAIKADVVYVTGGVGSKPGSDLPTTTKPGSNGPAGGQRSGPRGGTGGGESPSPKSGTGSRTGGGSRATAGGTAGVGFGGSLIPIIEKSEAVARQLRADAKAKLNSDGKTQGKVQTLGVTFGRHTDRTRQQLSQRLQETQRETSRGTVAVTAGQRQAADRTTAVTQSGTGAIIAALYATRPIVNVSSVTVQKQQSRRARGGASSGTAYRNDGLGRFGG